MGIQQKVSLTFVLITGCPAGAAEPFTMALAVRTNEPMQAFGIKLNQARIGVADFNPLVLNHPDPMGGALGCGWHRLVGCSTGSCPLMATPLRGITYGAGLGHIWASFR